MKERSNKTAVSGFADVASSERGAFFRTVRTPQSNDDAQTNESDAFPKPLRIALFQNGPDILVQAQGMISETIRTENALRDHVRAGGLDCLLLQDGDRAPSAFDLLQEIKSHVPNMPIIVLGARNDELAASLAISSGAFDHLSLQNLTPARLRITIEQAVARARLQSRLADQEDAHRAFLRHLVHDLRGPLRNIEVMRELVLRAHAAQDLDRLGVLISHQSTAAMQAADLVESLAMYALDYRSSDVRPVSLARIAEDVCTSLRDLISEENADVQIDKLPVVMGNSTQLTHLFRNLISNGIKFNESLTPKIRIEEDNGVISVRDNGIGVPHKHLQSIFLPLKRLWGASEYRGSGLGLAICKKIVSQHGGSIWATSDVGKGATFHIRFGKAARR